MAPDPDTVVVTAPVSRRAHREFTTLTTREVNFTPVDYDAAVADPDWHVDHRALALPTEPPGPPVVDGSFAVARQVLDDYEFADPDIVRAVYDAAAPLEGRDMLLEGRFFGLRFPMGVRVGGVVDGPGTEDGQVVQRYRWHYRTLEGHLERGQMDYELLKWHDTGVVEFRLHAYSQRTDISDPIVRLGFGLFGRPTQLRFYRRCLARMHRLVTERAVIRR